jgi:hypothetical protein
MAEQETTSDTENDFAAQSTGDRVGLVAEFVDFLKDNKKWWLAPIIISLDPGSRAVGVARRNRRGALYLHALLAGYSPRGESGDRLQPHALTVVPVGPSGRAGARP